MSDSPVAEIRKLISDSQSALIVTHVRPDGDAVGSMLGFGLALEGMGKEVQMVLADQVPRTFGHLPGVERIQKNPDGNEFDLIIVLDCSDLDRTGGVLNGYGEPDLNIDHHITNMEFARINLIDTQAVAVAEILANLFPQLDIHVTPSIAEVLLTGLLTDTIGFRTENVTTETLRTAVSLMESGATLSQLYTKALLDRSFESMRYWGAGLSRLQQKDGIVWTSLEMSDREKAGYSGNDDADLVNVLSSINGAQIAIIFIDQGDGNVKVSWRSIPGIDVSPIAVAFGGGGHAAASGAMVRGTLEQVQTNVLNATREMVHK
jgi:phosphoesterase RecJ-like protein